MRASFLAAVAAACLCAACATAGPPGGDHDGPATIDSPISNIDAPISNIDAPISNVDAPAGNTPVTLSQSSSTTILTGNSVACTQTATGYTAPNSYYRVFRLQDFNINSAFTATRIDFAVEDAEAGAGSQQAVTARLHILNGAFVTANLSTVAGQVVNVTNTTTGSTQSVPLSPAPVIPAGSTIVAEIAVPDGRTVGNIFFIGSNSSTETGSSYIKAPDCTANEPSTFASLSQPQVHIILSVSGTY